MSYYDVAAKSAERVGEAIQETGSKVVEKVVGHLPNARTVVKAIGTMAVATVAMEAIANATMASAGPITYAACILACSFAAPPAMPMCLAACTIASGPWCP